MSCVDRLWRLLGALFALATRVGESIVWDNCAVHRHRLLAACRMGDDRGRLTRSTLMLMLIALLLGLFVEYVDIVRLCEVNLRPFC